MGSSTSRQITLDNCNSEKKQRDQWKSKYNSMKGSKEYWTRRSLKAEKDHARYVRHYNAAMAQMRSWRSKYNTVNEKYNNLYSNSRRFRAQINQLNNTVNKLREQMGNTKSAKQSANDLFDSLQNRYLDRIDLLSTQENVLYNQNSLLNIKRKKINENEKTIDDYNEKIVTDNRSIEHDLDYNETKDMILKYIKVSFAVFILTIVLYKLYQYQMKK